mmetsp:Transcript_7860/g.10874  ORF Transcript_7860/g.10874 Transcript_7860/m.10874 type:complete len:730 (-) Transcript_7860:45-2234(-)
MSLANKPSGGGTTSGGAYTSLRNYGKDRKSNIEQPDTGKMTITVTEFDIRSTFLSKFTRYCINSKVGTSTYSNNQINCTGTSAGDSDGEIDGTESDRHSNAESASTWDPESKATVWRRYKDFIWLQQQLSIRHPGCIIPPLPKAKLYGRFTTPFIEARKRGLERFLQRASEHPEIKLSHYFIAFLRGNDVVFYTAKKDSKKSMKESSTALSTWVNHSINLTVTGQPMVENTESDLKIHNFSLFVEEEEKKMLVILRRIRNVIHPTRALAAALADSAECNRAFGTAEDNKCLVGLGSLLQQVSKLTAIQANSTYIGFLEPFKEYCRMLKSISLAIELRKKAKDRYLVAFADYERQQNIYKRVLLSEKSVDEMVAKEYKMRNAQQHVESCFAELESISSQLIEEFTAFKRQRSLDMKTILINFVKMQLRFNGEAESLSADSLIDIASVPLPPMRPVFNLDAAPSKSPDVAASGDGEEALEGDEGGEHHRDEEEEEQQEKEELQGEVNGDEEEERGVAAEEEEGQEEEEVGQEEAVEQHEPVAAVAVSQEDFEYAAMVQQADPALTVSDAAEEVDIVDNPFAGDDQGHSDNEEKEEFEGSPSHLKQQPLSGLTTTEACDSDEEDSLAEQADSATGDAVEILIESDKIFGSGIQKILPIALLESDVMSQSLDRLREKVFVEYVRDWAVHQEAMDSLLLSLSYFDGDLAEFLQLDELSWGEFIKQDKKRLMILI